MAAIAFFDFDKTLFPENSGSLWIKSELELGHLSYRRALRMSLWLVKYHLGFAELKEPVQRMIASLEGSEERLIKERVAVFYEKMVRNRYRPRAHQVIAAHKKSGDNTVLLSSTSSYMAELIQKELELDDSLCNRFEVDPRGMYTGRSVGEVCYGDGKLTLAKAYADARAVALSDCAFYTDSMSDVCVLEAVGRPVAVNPDPRLRRLAQKRGWAIEDWGRP
jgi:HAD superfamily hydrolase (TIGR01490 family)